MDDDMTGVERACVNVVIRQILSDWNVLNDGDGVELLRRLNCMTALSLNAQRKKSTSIPIQ